MTPTVARVIYPELQDPLTCCRRRRFDPTRVRRKTWIGLCLSVFELSRVGCFGRCALSSGFLESVAFFKFDCGLEKVYRFDIDPCSDLIGQAQVSTGYSPCMALGGAATTTPDIHE